MKRSNKKNYLVGAFGGLAVFFIGAVTPAQAVPFTDVNGNPCDTSQLVSLGMGAPSVCPDSLLVGEPGGPLLPDLKFARERAIEQYNQNTKDYGAGILFGLGDGSSSSATNGHLGMSINGGPSGDVTLGGGGYSLRNGGASTSDTAGLIAPGTNSASYRENGGGGGIAGIYDASRFVGSNQHLWFDGAFDYTNSSTNFGGIGAGSTINSNNYNFTGTALYSNYKT